MGAVVVVVRAVEGGEVRGRGGGREVEVGGGARVPGGDLGFTG